MLTGEGVGWLKLNRLKKLMEDENYRDLVVTKLNKGLNRKISPNDHIDDVVNFKYILIQYKLSSANLLNVFPSRLNKNLDY